MSLEDLCKKIERRSAKIGVIGLGYVGLPVAALFAKEGFEVVGVDIKEDRIEIINAGRSPIEGREPGLDELISHVIKSRKLHATNSYKVLKEADIVLIDVETPVNEEHVPEYQALRSALFSLASVMQKGTLIVVESTVMPGTMQTIVKPIIEEESGMVCNEDFYLGNCPERVMPGKLIHNLRKMSRIVGGGTQKTAEIMAIMYKVIVEGDVDTTDWITAEIVKTAENTYRDVQIAFANEVALICEELGADVWNVRELVRKSPGREMLLPGAGVGGHCIPKDPWLLASSVRESNVPVRLIPAARAINSDMPNHIFHLLENKLKDLGGKRILILGFAYLSDSDDTRNSPSADLVKLIKDTGAEVIIHDPFIKEYSGNIEEKAKDCNAAVLMTAHSEYSILDLYNLKKVMRTPIIIDGRNVLNKEKAVGIGFKFIRLGDTSKELK